MIYLTWGDRFTCSLASGIWGIYKKGIPLLKVRGNGTV